MYSNLRATARGAGLAVAALVSLASRSSTAQAQGTIHACYQNRTGALRVVISVNECTKKESPISWTSATDTQALIDAVSILEGRLALLEEQVVAANLVGMEGRLVAVEATDAGQDARLAVLEDAALDVRVSGLETRVSAIESAAIGPRVSALEGGFDTLDDMLACVHGSSNGENFYFNGCNVHVRNGSTGTHALNGYGNLVIGYNETGGGSPPVCSTIGQFTQESCEANGGVWAAHQRTGSHNLVIGQLHSYTQFGGLVAGSSNAITGWRASVVSGNGNVAGGTNSTVLGGRGNSAYGPYSSVSGGRDNIASGWYSSVLGGDTQEASADYSTVP